MSEKQSVPEMIKQLLEIAAVNELEDFNFGATVNGYGIELSIRPKTSLSSANEQNQEISLSTL